MNRRNEKAITLIALVVTIVVLLILAGVSIAMLTGENGIITQAQEARRANKEAEIKEKVELAVMAAKTAGQGKIDFPTLNDELKKIGYEEEEDIIEDLPETIEIDGVKVKINEDGSVEIVGSGDNNDSTEQTILAALKASEEPVEGNTTIEDTEGDSITIPAGFNVDKDSPIIVTEGIVVEDRYENQYVWIPVFEKCDERDWGADYSAVTTAKTADKTEFTSTDYRNIKTALKTYTATYADSSYKDEWYGDDSNGQYGYIDAEGNIVYYSNGNMTESEYNELYNNMLVSVYKNGGFYIGRYEMGIGVATTVEKAESLTRTSMSEYVSTYTNEDNEAPTIAGMATPVSKANAVGYNHITQSQAQMLAEKMGEEYGYGETTSSLMFGVQWDVVCVFLEKYATLNNGTAFNSSYLTDPYSYGNLWGNYESATFTMDRGFYTIKYESSPVTWNEKSTVAKDGADLEYWLCTTGTSDQNCALNIYDFGGNLSEWSLERLWYADRPGVLRGGSFRMTGAASDRVYEHTIYCNEYGVYSIRYGARSNLCL